MKEHFVKQGIINSSLYVKWVGGIEFKNIPFPENFYKLPKASYKQQKVDFSWNDVFE